MPRIGDFQLPETTVVDKRTEFVLGRVRGIVRLTAFLTRFSSRQSFREAIEELEREIERFDRGETDLSVHTGRSLQGRRRKWTLTRDDDRCLAVGELEVLADDRFERSETESQEAFSLTSSPQTCNLSVGGNWNALPVLRLTASTAIANPAFSNGNQSLRCSLGLEVGDVLELDSENQSATKNGDTNVLSSTSGDFVQLSPGSPVLEYSDENAAGRGASLVVTWRDRWV